MSYQEAFDSFMQEFDSACDKATEAGYSVELCSDGSYRAEQAMKDKFEEAMKLLEESEKCGECWGSGKILLDAGYEVSCLNCDGTGRTD